MFINDRIDEKSEINDDYMESVRSLISSINEMVPIPSGQTEFQQFSVLTDSYTFALYALKRGRRRKSTDSVSFVSFATDGQNISKLYKKRYVEGSPWYILPKVSNNQGR